MCVQEGIVEFVILRHAHVQFVALFFFVPNAWVFVSFFLNTPLLNVGIFSRSFVGIYIYYPPYSAVLLPAFHLLDS